MTPTTVASASDKDLDGGATRGEPRGRQIEEVSHFLLLVLIDEMETDQGTML